MKALQKASLLILAAVSLAFFGASASMYFNQEPSKASGQTLKRDTQPSKLIEPLPETTSLGGIDTISVWRLVNSERYQAGLSPLVFDTSLERSALSKCQDMSTKQYFEHNAPDGTKPWKHFKDAGIKFASAAENLAFGQTSSEEVVRMWMASPGHKEAILDNYTNVGIAVCAATNYMGGTGSTVITVQHFSSL